MKTIGSEKDLISMQREWTAAGLIRETFPLANTRTIPLLLTDYRMYKTEITRNHASNLYRIPYLLTESIIEVAHDPNILRAVSGILGTGELVMWGPNIQCNTPTGSEMWHTDIESWLWPAVSVIVGLESCNSDNSTKCIPSSFKIDTQPWRAANNADDALVLKAANILNPECKNIEQFENFADGRFYVFDAKNWHAGALYPSRGRTVLLMHYDKASSYRIPYMENYMERTWFDYPAVYIPINKNDKRDFFVNRQLQNTLDKNYLGSLPDNFEFIYM